jgi:hypothetical protein
MYMRATFALFCAVLAVTGECVLVSETRQGNLEVFATDITGQRIKGVELRLFTAGGGVADVTAKSTRVRAHYGEYRLRVEAMGFHQAWRDIRIDQPEAMVQVELAIGTLGCPDPPASIGGRITWQGPKSELWVKAVPVRGTGGTETLVSNQGHFVISGLKRSTYLLIVMHGTRYCIKRR